MSLQELTAALRQKEDDKSEVIKTLQVMNQLAVTKGVVGRILFQVTECFFEDMKFDIVILPTDSYIPVESSDLNNKSLKEETEVYVDSKEVALEIHFLVAGLEYVALLDIPEVPDNSSISMSVEAVCAANGAKADVRVKATFDYIAEIVRSKSVELEQVMEDVKEIKLKVQTAARGVMSKKPPTKKSSAVTKKSAPVSADSDDDVEEVEEFEDDDEEEDQKGGSYTAMVQGYAAATVGAVVSNKAIGMFLAFSLAIYFQGDQMSV